MSINFEYMCDLCSSKMRLQSFLRLHKVQFNFHGPCRRCGFLICLNSPYMQAATVYQTTVPELTEPEPDQLLSAAPPPCQSN